MRVVLGFVILCLALGAGLAVIAEKPIAGGAALGGLAVVIFGSLAAYMVAGGGRR